MTMKKGPPPVFAKEGLKDLFSRSGYAERHGSPGESFAETNDVWFLIQVLAGEHPARATKSGQDLVGNAEYPLGAGLSEQRVHKNGIVNAHAACGLKQRFINECREIWSFPAEQFTERAGIFARGGIDEHDFKKIVAEWVGEDAALADGHGAERVAVVGMAEGQDPGPLCLALVPPKLDGHFDGNFDGR